MFRVRDIVTGDLKDRVNELLDATADTNNTIDELRKSIDRLTAVLQSGGRLDPSTLAGLKSITADWVKAADSMKASAATVNQALNDLEKKLGLT